MSVSTTALATGAGAVPATAPMTVLAIPPLLTIKKARELLGWPRTRIYNLVADGMVEMKKCGKQRLLVGESVAQYINRLPTVAPRTSRDAS